MARARGDSGLDGFLNLCKPGGPSSHDQVATARRLLGTRRIGHAGTLDPLAEGVLPLALGRATRLVERLASADKTYYAEALLGRRTTTDDIEGAELERSSVPHFTLSDLESALDAFRGELEQRPPAYSAIKIRGRRAYELAREGRQVTLSARRVTIYSIAAVRWEHPVLSLVVGCSKGTYIRSLARDFGEHLGVPSVLLRLVRLRVGPFALATSVSLAELEEYGAALVLPPDVLLKGLPATVMGGDERVHLQHGRVWLTQRWAAVARAYTAQGHLGGTLRGKDGRWYPDLGFLD